CATNEELRELQTFVVVGGGPTGVELAGMLPSVAMDAIREDFRRVNTRETRVILLEGGPRILPTFPESLGTRAAEDLRKLGVDVRTGALVTRIEDDAVYVGDERIGTRNVYWAAGNARSEERRVGKERSTQWSQEACKTTVQSTR